MLGLVAACAVLLALASACSYADNMVLNPSFENFTAGTTYPEGSDVWLDTWRYFSGAGSGGTMSVITPGEDGDVALKIAKTSTSVDTGLGSDDIAVEEGKAYRVSVWAKSDNAATFKFTVASFIGSRSGTHLGDTVSCTFAPTTAWHKYEVVYIAPATCDAANISFRPVSTTGSVYIDNVSMEETDNSIGDPSFDNWTAGSTYNSEIIQGQIRFFSGSGTGGVMNIVTPGRTGDTAIELSRTSVSSDTGFGTYYKIPVIAGHTYRASVWVKTATGCPLRFTVASYSSPTAWITDTVNTFFTPTVTTGWELLAVTYTAPVNCKYASVAFRANSDTGSVIVDDASFIDEAAITGNLFPDGSMDTYQLGASYTSENNIGPFKFFAISPSGGSLTIVPGQDGSGTALQMSRTSLGGDSGWGMTSITNDRRVRVPVKYGHMYNCSYYAKSTTGTGQVREALTGYHTDKGTKVDEINLYSTPGTDWTLCSNTYTPSHSTLKYVNAGLRVLESNTAFSIDNMVIEDITSSCTGSLSGTVIDGLTGTAIEGATVTIKSESATLSATTDASGTYTISSVPGGTYELAASASGYVMNVLCDVTVATAVTRNIGIFPADTTWSVYDTFTRTTTESEPLGTTEGSFAIPWLKTENSGVSATGNINSFIDSGKLITYAGSNYCGAALGQSFVPGDFDLSVEMNWLSTSSGQWSGIAYRQVEATARTAGYFVSFPYAGDAITLQYNGNPIASAKLTTASPYWQNATVRIVVCDDSHKVYVNGTLLLDVTDTNDVGGGYIGVFGDSTNMVEWDNLSITSLPDGMITGFVYDSATGEAISGATVTIAETGEELQPDTSGAYSRTLAHGTYTLTANADGYIPQTKSVVVKYGETATADFVMTAYTNVDSIIDAKELADGTVIRIAETLVATVDSSTYSEGSYYLENENRAYGIKVYNGDAVSEGSRVTGLCGTIKTNVSGERYIDVIGMTAVAGDPLGALGMNNKALVNDAAGNGLLVKTWGTVKTIDSSTFMTIDDGSGATFYVCLSGLTAPVTKTIAVGDYVAVTGAAGFATYDNVTYPAIRPRGDSDIDLY